MDGHRLWTKLEPLTKRDPPQRQIQWYNPNSNIYHYLSILRSFDFAILSPIEILARESRSVLSSNISSRKNLNACFSASFIKSASLRCIFTTPPQTRDEIKLTITFRFGLHLFDIDKNANLRYSFLLEQILWECLEHFDIPIDVILYVTILL